MPFKRQLRNNSFEDLESCEFSHSSHSTCPPTVELASCSTVMFFSAAAALSLRGHRRSREFQKNIDARSRGTARSRRAAARSREEPRGAARSEPRRAAKSCEEPRGAARSREEPRGATGSRQEPRAARSRRATRSRATNEARTREETRAVAEEESCEKAR